YLGARATRFNEPDTILAHLVISRVTMAEPIAILADGAVFQRFPTPKCVTVESGVCWFTWMANYMDETWKKQRSWTKSPLTEPPSFYMDRNVYGSFIHDDVGVINRNLPGGKNIMWSSDYPHSETTYPHSQEVIDRLFKGVPEADQAEILGGIARRVFRTGDGRAAPSARQAAE